MGWQPAKGTGKMKTVTTHEAKTHLSRLLKEVQRGEEIIILSGKTPMARLTAISQPGPFRPKVGTITSAPVHLSPDAFKPMTDEEIDEWTGGASEA